MYKIQTLNKISSAGLNLLPRDKYETASEIVNPNAVILRSFNMHDIEIPESVLGIARAGAGTNNIPIPKCTERGIIVFNTPGANANSVKEMVIASIIISARNLSNAIAWTKSIVNSGEEVPKLIEKGKSLFAGTEIKGKRLGVVGLGAIGVMVANDASALGMKVTGFDPFISVESAWGLSRDVKKGISLDSVLADSDFISIHMPINDETKGIINKNKFKIMKKGVKIINFARGGIVNNADIKEALAEGTVSNYITDFPEEDLIKTDNVICIPHLGASTEEAEENCATMAAMQIMDFLETGNIKNSVNFPDCKMDFNGTTRLTITNKNVPNIIAQISSALAESKINISEFLNKHRNDVAYNIIDIDSDVSDDVINKLKTIDGIISVRKIDIKK
ncbi:MAG: 3-phosphoglycerate dehydrogenase family protein [Spirochaetaceae bacterium]|nr:3-phosphoglycerate dehydrogenase family protein [Spirochaetaceae bacterium]